MLCSTLSEPNYRISTMKYLKYLPIAALFSAVAFAATADEKAASASAESVMDKPSFSASQSMTVSAVVTAIDHDTRVVTVRKPDGEELTFTASEEVRNLPQVQVGDVLVAEYVESVSIEVMADDGLGTDAAEAVAMGRAEEGAMPGFAAMDSQIVIAKVEEINLELNTFKLKGPDGVVEEFVARNPDNLRRAEVGDLVVITTTEAVAITVERQPAE
jgi:Cu/Ag efflux protein CusF